MPRRPDPLDKLTMEELQARRLKIEGDPANQMPEGSFYRFTPKARRKLDAIAWAITRNMDARRRREEV